MSGHAPVKSLEAPATGRRLSQSPAGPCPVCGDVLRGPVVRDLLRCQGCQTYRRQQIPNREELRKANANHMLTACQSAEGEQRRIRKANYQLDLLERHVEPGRVFDVGAAGGFFMKAAQDRGWECAGNDLSTRAIEWAENRWGIEIFYGFLEDLGFRPESYDAVVLWNTLEHVENPRQTMDCCFRMLRPGGVALIEVPAKLCLAEIARSYESLHLTEFNPLSLHSLLVDTGFLELESHPAPGAADHIDVLYRRDVTKPDHKPGRCAAADGNGEEKK